MTYIINKNVAKIALKKEGEIVGNRIDFLLKDYPPIYPPLDNAVRQWLEDYSISPIKIEGLSISDIMEKRQSHFLVAVKELNMLLDESIPSEKRARWKKLISKFITYE